MRNGKGDSVGVDCKAQGDFILLWVIWKGRLIR